jgi:hypothetical protein
VKRATIIVMLLLTAAASAREQRESFAAFREIDLQRNKQIALRAINSPEAWRRFPKREHQRHYTPLTREISFAFTSTSTGYCTMYVIIPTTHVGPRHRTDIYVRLDGRGDLLDMEEVPEI